MYVKKWEFQDIKKEGALQRSTWNLPMTHYQLSHWFQSSSNAAVESSVPPDSCSSECSSKNCNWMCLTFKGNGKRSPLLILLHWTGVWQLTRIPTANQPNTYSVLAQQRTTSCNIYLGAQICSESDRLFLYNRVSVHILPCLNILSYGLPPKLLGQRHSRVYEYAYKSWDLSIWTDEAQCWHGFHLNLFQLTMR